MARQSRKSERMYGTISIVRAKQKTYIVGTSCTPGLIVEVTERQAANHRDIVGGGLQQAIGGAAKDAIKAFARSRMNK